MQVLMIGNATIVERKDTSARTVLNPPIQAVDEVEAEDIGADVEDVEAEGMQVTEELPIWQWLRKFRVQLRVKLR